jgi:exodeoxyribonuclease VII small subunit
MTSNRKPRSGLAAANGRDHAQAAADTPQGPAAFEEALSRLDAIVASLEGGQLPLEEALRLYEEGVHMAQRCQQLLDEADLRVQALRATSGTGGAAMATFTLETIELDENE